MKYNYIDARGYWDDDAHKAFDVKISTSKWDGKFDDDDHQIFYYLDEDETLKEGDIIADNFTITKIYRKDKEC